MPTAEETVARIKELYPQYRDVNDAELGRRVFLKYPKAYPQLKGYTAPPTREQVDIIRNQYFNDENNIPHKTARALAKNPNDAAAIEAVGKMHPATRQAILERAGELAWERGRKPPTILGAPGSSPAFGGQPGKVQEYRTGAGAGSELAATAIHGPEGARQLAARRSFGATMERFALGFLDPEQDLLAMLIPGGKAVGLGLTGLQGYKAYQSYREGHKGEAAAEGLIGLAALSGTALGERGRISEARQTAATAKLAADIQRNISEDAARASKLAYEKRALGRIGKRGRAYAEEQARMPILAPRQPGVSPTARSGRNVRGLLPAPPSDAVQTSVEAPMGRATVPLPREETTIQPPQPTSPRGPMGLLEAGPEEAAARAAARGPVAPPRDARGRFAKRTKGEADAIRQRASEEVLQREPQPPGSAGGGRGRVEQGVEGQTPAGDISQVEAAARGDEGRVEPVPPPPSRQAAGALEGRAAPDAYGPAVHSNVNPATGQPFQVGEKVYIREGGGNLDTTVPHTITAVGDKSVTLRGSAKAGGKQMTRTYRWDENQIGVSPAEHPSTGLRGKLEAAETFLKGQMAKPKKGTGGSANFAPMLALVPVKTAEKVLDFAEWSQRVLEKLSPELHDSFRSLSKSIYAQGLREAGVKVAAAGSAPSTAPAPAAPEEDPTVAAVLKKLREAKRKAPMVKQQYRVQRGSRFGAYEQQRAAGKTQTEAGVKAAKGVLKGQLEQPEYEPLPLAQNEADALHARIENSPLYTGNVLTAHEGLDKMLGRGDYEGNPRIPAPHEIKQLRKVFGDKFVDDMTSHGYRNWFRTITDILGVPRAIMETGNLHATLRQALPLSIGNPKAGLAALARGAQAMVSDKAARTVDTAVRSGPNAQLYDEFGLHFSGPRLVEREEDFQSSLAEKIPLLGPIVRSSRRSFSTQLNVLRSKVFDDGIAAYKRAGIMPDTHPEEFKGLASYINKMTGWGEFGKMEDMAAYLNTVVYSPRLQASRLQLMKDALTGFRGYPKLARRRAIKDLALNVGFQFSMLAFAKYMGADVSTDPNSADFGKVKVGDTRIDITGGFGSLLRPIARFIAGEYQMRKTGKPPGYGKQSPLGVLGRSARSKLAPVPSLAVDLAEGRDFAGAPMVTGKEIGKEVTYRFSPIFLHEVVQGMLEGQGASPALLTPIAFFGGGAQTYQQGNRRSENRP